MPPSRPRPSIDPVGAVPSRRLGLTAGDRGSGETTATIERSARALGVSRGAPSRCPDVRHLILLAPLGSCAMGGAMHQATIVGQCAVDDVACSRRHPQAPLAIGTRFHPEVSAEIGGTTTPTLRFESALPTVLAVQDGTFVAKAAGATAVLISTDDGSIVDFIHVWVAPVTKITLARRDGDRARRWRRRHAGPEAVECWATAVGRRRSPLDHGYHEHDLDPP